MKILVFALMIVCAGSMITDEKGPHGGRLQKTDNYFIEVKRDYSHFYVYLLDENKKTISSNDINCDIRFYVLDGSTIDMPMKAYNQDGFTLDYLAKNYNSYRITFKLAGKDVSAKFETENALVKEAAPGEPILSEQSTPR